MKLDYLYTPILHSAPVYEVAIVLTIAFSMLYFSMATSLFYAVKLLNRMGVTEKIIDRPYFKGQIGFEIKQSLWSIVIFALYGVLIVILFRQGAISISFGNGWMILIDLCLLIIWNEFHFYVGHRLMHSDTLVKFHRVHHRSVVVTPFSTYSFHPLESLIMGSVMIIPLLIYPFEIWALIVFPVYHLFFNTIGHTNIAFKSRSKHSDSISSRHNLHHTKFSVNYGFVSTLTDRLARLIKWD